MSRRNWFYAAALILVFYVVTTLPSIYGDFLWFGSLDYNSVFVKILAYKIGLFVLFSVVTYAVVSTTYRRTVKNVRKLHPDYRPSGWAQAGIAVFSLLVGGLYTGTWKTFLRYLNSNSFGQVDPVYGNDVAFYVFDLPLYELVVGYLLFISLASLVVALAIYAIHYGLEEHEEVFGQMEQKAVEFEPRLFVRRLKQHGYGQIMSILGFLLIVLGFGFFLDRYGLLFSERGAVFGVGATDAAIMNPLLLALAFISIVGGLLYVLNTRLQDRRITYSVAILLVVLFVGGNVAAGLYQSYVVDPDEFNKEQKYIENEINFTRNAFALDRVDTREFEVTNNLTREEIDNNPGTIDNLRLWDYRPLLETYNQEESLRLYYTFRDIDTDRYHFNGTEKQVMLSAREINLDNLETDAKSWINRHLVYTHGFGVAMNSVNKATEEGIPKWLVEDIPPKMNIPLKLDQPRIYYGEGTGTYTIVNTDTRELDYPTQDQNVYNSYNGTGGVEINGLLNRIVYAINFGSPQIFFSGSINSDSRIQFHRNIDERVREIAPFLEYDDDPYVVIADGRLKWIYDAYTTTDRYPYSQPTEFNQEHPNYLRNSVKVVVDAYSGETNYYVVDEEDPIAETYKNIFPDLFQPMSAMSEDVRKHIRYPEDAFQVQSDVYRNYHMKDPRVFYNKEDAWKVPQEVYRKSGNKVDVEPYYLIMKIPGKDKPEFVQILPFTPNGKQNMIGWLAAQSDPPNYGEIKAFEFSKQKLIYGPSQIESRIDQNTRISELLSLWNQRGSEVIRGNLLAIPVSDTILYVEPLFLRSTGGNSIPELKRVIVAQGDKLTMQKTLADGLNVLFGEEVERPTGPGVPGVPGVPGGVSESELRELRNIYSEAKQALKDGQFGTYGEKIEELGKKLDEMEVQPKNGTSGNLTVNPTVPSSTTENISTPSTP
ncbi:MAG: UPF0182 family protein [Halobacteria archaeon]